MGISLFGFFASCAAVETASKPMNAKNTIAAPPNTPPHPHLKNPSCPGVPSGIINGVWFSGLINCQPKTINNNTMATLINTMIPLSLADSCVPLINTMVNTNNITSAGKLIIPETPFKDSKGEWDHS